MTMTDARLARIAAHEANLKRYARLLTTELTDVERAFIHKRIAEEHLTLERLYSLPEEMAAPHLAAAQFAPTDHPQSG
jgi:hypothetical protein